MFRKILTKFGMVLIFFIFFGSLEPSINKMLSPLKKLASQPPIFLPYLSNELVFAAEEGDKAKKDDKKKTDDKNKDTKTTEAAPCPECPECPDPAKFVLSGLEDRKKKLDEDEAKLKLERKELENFKEEIDENLAKLEVLKKQIQDDLAAIQKVKSEKERQKEAEHEAKLQSLSVVYAKMPTKNAAGIFDKMNVELAADIIARMPPKPASKILSEVQMEQASKISERLAQKKK